MKTPSTLFLPLAALSLASCGGQKKEEAKQPTDFLVTLLHHYGKLLHPLCPTPPTSCTKSRFLRQSKERRDQTTEHHLHDDG